MTNKKIIVLAILIVSLFAVYAVSAADNLTDDVVSADLTTDDIASYDLESEDAISDDENATDGQKILTVSEEDDEVSLNDNDDVLSYYYPDYYDYSVTLYDTSIGYEDGGSITMYISPCTYSNYYRFYYYFGIYDSDDDLLMGQYYSSTYSSTSSYTRTYSVGSYNLSPGTYTMKIINYDDNHVMATATLTVKSSYPSSEDYKVNIYDTSIDYGDSGSINMHITPSTSTYYKYYYYLIVYDLNDNQKISQLYYSSYSYSSEDYYISSGGLSPGEYIMKIVNCADYNVMASATLTISPKQTYSYDSTFSGLKSTIDYSNQYTLINLTKDILNKDYSSEISISKSLIIDGNGHTIDANNASRIFYISGNNVVLKNIVFKNAYYSSGNGAAIYWSGSNGQLINCTFIDNYDSYDYGGAVYWYGSNGRLLNSTFINNRASYNGGAVYWAASNGKLLNCNFVNNTASNNGGAVYWSNYYANITNCDFTSNSAIYQGGAVYLSSSATISDSNFKSNGAEYGGAVAVGTSNSVDIYNSKFNNNVADYGSAIKWYYSLGSTENCTFNGAKSNSHKYMYISSKLDSSIYVNVDDITLGEKLNLTISWNSELQGNMSIDIFSERMNKTVYSSVKQLDGLSKSINLLIPNLKSSDYILDVVYSGDNIFYGDDVTEFFTVWGKASNITFTVQDTTWGTPIVLNPTVTSGATGLIKIYVNDDYIDSFNVGSKYNLLGVGGPYSDITLIYVGDDNYRSCEYTQRVYVERLDSALILPDKFVSGYSTIPIIFNPDATGYVTVNFAGESYSGYLDEGIFEFDTRYMVGSGNRLLSIEYGGDGKYNPYEKSQYVDVEIQIPTLELNIANVQKGNSVDVKPYIRGATGSYSIYVDDVYEKSIENGYSYTIQSPSLGKHDVRVLYSGDSYYSKVENQTAFRVYKFYPIKVENTKIIYGTDKYFKATFYDEYGSLLSNRNVIFNVNGTNYYRSTDENGTAVLDMKFKMGEYPITIINIDVNEKYFTTLTIFTSIQAEDMIRYYNSGYDFNATFFDNDAKALSTSIVLFDINGTLHHAETDGKGYAKLIVPLSAGTYKVTSINPVTNENATNKLTIISSIKSEDMSRAYNSTIDYKATFYDVDGGYLKNHTVTFDLGFKQYNVRTDMAGQAILNIGLAQGEYNITSINPVTNQRNVNKLTILERIINNNDVIVYGNEETYYKVRVIDNNAVVCGAGETVSFYLNGKSYNIKTGSDGYASLKITESSGIHVVSASYKGYTVFNDVTVLENVASVLALDVNNINYGQTAVVNVSVNPQYSNGNVDITIKGSNGYEKSFNQRAYYDSITKEIEGLNASSYQVTAIFTDFDDFYFNKVTKSFNVLKVTPDVIVVCEGAEYGENSTITVNVPKASGNVTIKVGDKTFAESIIADGVIIKRISDLRPGNYSVSVTYAGNNNFNKASKTAALEVLRGSVGFYATVGQFSYGQDVTTTLTSSFPGKVTLTVGSITKTVDITANKDVTVSLGKLNAGKYTLNAKIDPSDKNYESVTDSVSFEVSKAKSTVSVKAENIEIGQATKITVTLSNGLNGNVKLELGGKEYTQATSSSTVTFNINGLKVGKYTPKATFGGNANFNASSGTVSFDVKKIQNMNTIIPNAVSNIDYDFACDLPKDASGTVTVSIDGNDYTANVVNGKANVKLPKLSNGNYPCSVKYSGDNKYAGFTTSNTIKISKSTIKSGDANVIYGSGYDYKTTFINNDGTPLANTQVSFLINGKVFKTTTDSKGVATLKIGLGNGVYQITAINPKNGETVTNTLKIVGGTTATIIYASQVSADYNSGKMMTVTLKDIFDRPLASTPVSINVAGKNNVVITNSKGQASLSVSSFVPASYVAKVTFTGSNKYTASSASASVKVNKAKVKLIAAKKKFKSKVKTKKYTVTLKNNKNKAMSKVKLTLKINGKTYKATTNKKGKATFKITKLTKKGKFKSTVKFAGNKYFKALSKKVVITSK